MLMVTGASGLLGLAVVLSARQQGRDVVAISRHHALHIGSVASSLLDLTDHASVQALLSRTRPEAVIHCAAATQVDWCEDHPQEAFAINAGASGVLAQVAHAYGAKFVYVSTDAVFDGTRGGYVESDEPSPVNVYARSKLAGENEVLKECGSALVVRATLYGWNAQPKQCLAEWMWDGLRQGHRRPGFTDVFFTPILVNDLAEIFLHALDRGLSGVFHAGSRERISKYEFGRRLAAMFGFSPGNLVPTRSSQANLRAARPSDPSLNSEKIVAALGHAMPAVDAGLRRFRDFWDMGHVQRWKTMVSGVTA